MRICMYSFILYFPFITPHEFDDSITYQVNWPGPKPTDTPLLVSTRLLANQSLNLKYSG